MDGFFTDWAEDDSGGFFNEDDDCHCDDYDPEEIEAVSDYEDTGVFEDADEADIYAFEEDVDDPSIHGIMLAAGVIGGMMSEEIADSAQAKQRVSMQQFQEGSSPTTPQKKKLHLRPFEKWVNEVLTGKRTVRDLSRLDQE